jgi:hypothetical protein
MSPCAPDDKEDEVNGRGGQLPQRPESTANSVSCLGDRSKRWEADHTLQFRARAFVRSGEGEGGKEHTVSTRDDKLAANVRRVRGQLPVGRDR